MFDSQFRRDLATLECAFTAIATVFIVEEPSLCITCKSLVDHYYGATGHFILLDDFLCHLHNCISITPRWETLCWIVASLVAYSSGSQLLRKNSPSVLTSLADKDDSKFSILITCYPPPGCSSNTVFWNVILEQTWRLYANMTVWISQTLFV